MAKRKRQLSPRKEPSQERSKDTVEVILKAVTYILIKEGMRGFNTNNVAKVAGVSIGSVYQYFPNKESLLSALVEQKLHADKKFFEEKLKGFEKWPLEEKFFRLIMAGIELHRADHKILKVMFEQLGGTGQMELVNQMNMALYEMVLGIILSQKGKNTDMTRAEHQAYIVYQLILSIWHSQVESKWMELSSQTIAKMSTKMVLNAIEAQ